jgi:hypothetical protein
LSAQYFNMRRIVFYSWQSDLPNATNRGFIQTALEQAAASIAADNTVAVEPVVDRDTQNIPGSPDIASTIFAKIAASDIFVADVSIITQGRDVRRAPNPNVLIELGYALKALGHERVVLVLNRCFGNAEELPFDLRTRRILVYEMAESAPARAPERQKLEKQLEAALRAALAVVPENEAAPPSPAVTAIENVAPNRKVIVRRTLDALLKTIDGLEPKKPRDGGTVDDLIAGINNTQEAVAEFSKIAEAIAVMNDAESVFDLCHWFGRLFERYDLPDNFSGGYSEGDFDFFKFLGHETFVTLVSFLMREERWETLNRVLDEPIPTRVRNRGRGTVNWEYASEYLPFIMSENSKRERVSLHADLLNQRHADGGGLATITPMDDLMDGDFFLFLLSRTLKDDAGYDRRYWRAWSCLYLKHAPIFVQRSVKSRFAQGVATALNLESVAAFKKLLAERGHEIRQLYSRSMFWDYPVGREDVNKIATL